MPTGTDESLHQLKPQRGKVVRSQDGRPTFVGQRWRCDHKRMPDNVNFPGCGYFSMSLTSLMKLTAC
jgi:hypothetical protein